MELWTGLAGLCAGHVVVPASGIVAGLFLAGLTGSLAHCTLMCGPLVLAQVSDGLARLPAKRLCEFHRLGAGALLPYHSGRLATYAAIGAAAAFAGGALGRLAWFGWLSGALLLAGGVVLLTQAARAAGLRLRTRSPDPRHAPARPAVLTRLAARVRKLGGFGLGMVMGLLPCGFLYGALTVAAASASPLAGAAAMLAFGVGTLPSLIAVGVAGHAAGARWLRGARALAPVMLMANAALLILLASHALTAALVDTRPGGP